MDVLQRADSWGANFMSDEISFLMNNSIIFVL